MKKNKLLENYKEEYENKYVAVMMDTGDVFDFDISFRTIYHEIPKTIRERLFFFYVKNKEFTFIPTEE